MSEIEKAIMYWEEFKQEAIDMIAEGKYSNSVLEKQIPMCNTALAALREKADREKSEQWCKKKTNGGLLAICPKCNYPVSWWYKTPFCANCGKRLEVEHGE